MGHPATREADNHEAVVNLAIYDFHEAIDQGESPDPAEWAARYPEITAELRAYFDDLARLGLLGLPRLESSPDETIVLGGSVSAEPDSRPRAIDLRTGDVLGDYVLLEILGEGGQGVVWKARAQNAHEIVVALKTLRGPTSGELASADRLRADARAIARMRHENIIRTFYFGEDRGRWFFVMELMEGGTVADRLASFASDPRSAAVLVEKVARAIHHAHTRNPGVLHLDLKPGNLLLTAEGEPKVTDFGLSMRLEAMEPPIQEPGTEEAGEPDGPDDRSATFERAGIVGTLPYLSPEMAGGRWSDVSTASDIYGLGAILYAMLTGREPFHGQDARQTLALVLRGDLTPPSELNPAVDRELESVCLKCLDRDPGRRYGSADALANELSRWLDRRPTLAGGRPSAIREARFWVRRHPLGLASAGLIILLLWGAGLAIRTAELRAENAREAIQLARIVDRELRLIRRATLLLASDPRLREAFEAFPSLDQNAQLRQEIEAFLRTAIEEENLFGIAGENPFVNVFVLDPDGVLRADTLVDSSSVGKRFHVRDYYRTFFDAGSPRMENDAYVARSFDSVKDRQYKIAVSTPIRGEADALLGLLVANFTIGPRLVDVDMRAEAGEAVVLCPIDRSDPLRGLVDPLPPWPYLPVLDRRYEPGSRNPLPPVEPSQLPDFQGNPDLDHAVTGPWGGRLVDYHRVGQTHMIVKRSRGCPWPLSWLPKIF
ncbi:serine/threonine protein kinase [Tautonia marina]|uniref:serine/threonine protein kinase n=1 Tax=Tautonia marina TaxID=2653855 RepID=UPI001260E011|nr:serine/threonine protein kinase [Tautonia marina]